MPQLLTIGYEGLSQDQFYAQLHHRHVQTLIDVRQLPLSRKAGFSKSALCASTTVHDIDYVHLSAFGCPRTIRYDYRDDGDWERYTKRFLEYLDTQGLALIILEQMVRASQCCLLCYEADFNRCHRMYVANALADIMGADLEIVHITVSDSLQVHG